jgi:FdhD protein
MTTGRISSDIVIKVARAGIQLIVSHSAPTSLAIRLAEAANITIVGFARGSRMNIYCNEDRII